MLPVNDLVERWQPIGTSLRLIWRAGPITLGLYVLAFAVLTVGTGWLQYVIYHAFGPHESFWWIAWDEPLTLGVAQAKDYAGKARPVVILQDDSFDGTKSITICAFTTDDTDAPLFRLAVEPNERNGLRSSSRLMVDKITTVPKSKAGERIGRLDDEDAVRLDRALMVFLGLAVSPKAGRKRE